MGERQMKVVVDDAHLGDLEGVCGALRAAGLVVEDVIAEAGAIFGHYTTGAEDAIAHVEGVVSATEEGTFQVPPDEGDVPR